jgi:DNA processing protein
MKKLKYWVWLNTIYGLGSIKTAKLLKIFSEPENIWNSSYNDLLGCNFLNKNDVEQLQKKDLKPANEIIKSCDTKNIDIITMDNPRYPKRLKEMPDPPYVLYIKGSVPDDNLWHIGIVGSRKATYYGRSLAEEFSFQLAKKGFVIVSGMARGIDSCAHRGALKADGITQAVLGCGVDIPYPKENADMMNYISKMGAILSEYPPSTMPIAGNFPARNRIISGLCDIILVIEAGERSGARITADFAIDYGREVMAVPGNVDSYYSRGSNNLIKEGAKLINCVEDILEEIPEYNNNDKKTEIKIESREVELTNNEKNIFDYLSKTPLHIDELCRNTGYDIKELNSILTMLEMKDCIEQLPGKQFVKK